MRTMIMLLGVMALAVASPAVGADKKPASAAPALKVGKDQKLCQHKFPDGQKTSWVCDKTVPCCAWDAIKYVKCGTTFTGCL